MICGFEISDHLHRLSLRYYDHARTGVLVSTITTDVATIQSFASSSTLDIVIDLITIVFMVGLMFWLEWDFTLIAVAFTPVLLVFVFHLKKAVKQTTRVVRARQSDLLSIVQRGIGSIRVTKAFGRQDLEMAHLEAASHATVDAALRARRIKSLMSPVVSIVVAICTAVVLWQGTSLIVAGTMTAGALTVYLAYLKQFFKPVKDLASMTSTVAQTTVALKQIQTILSADEVIKERADPVDPGRVRGAVTFDRVTFGYGVDQHVLHEVSFTIEPGQVVGIVGPTGSGKSTVLSLLPRFYDPMFGRVRIDGVDVADYKLAALRSQIGFVLQDTMLFPGTIGDNTPMAGRGQPRTKSSPPRGLPMPMSSSAACRSATMRSWASTATRCPAANASGSRSRAQSFAIARSWCWTNRRRHWTRSPNIW